MLVYCANESPRLTYVLDEIFSKRLGITWKCTDNEAYFLKTSSYRLNYSNTVFPSCLNIPADGLLYQEDIVSMEPDVKELPKWGQVLFPFTWEIPHDIPQPTVCIPFDFLSACFYLLSRYEEYQPGAKRDEHGRFKADQSLAYRFNFLERPLLDEWVLCLREKLLKQYPELDLAPLQFSQLNTIDIDFAFKYKGLSTKAKIRKVCGALLRFDKEALNYLLGTVKHADPYDTYAQLLIPASKKKVETRFFVLLSDAGSYDKNINPKSRELKELLSHLILTNKIGIHPSYKSGISKRVLQQECNLFQEILGFKPSSSRQHFLKLKFPETPRNLLAMDIKEDYSLGYSEALGFRASTAYPFCFFDLPANEKSSLVMFSSIAMDVTLRNYLKLTPSQAARKIHELKAKVQTSGGVFVSIWHNSSFDKMEGWDDWLEVYESLFQ